MRFPPLSIRNREGDRGDSRRSAHCGRGRMHEFIDFCKRIFSLKASSPPFKSHDFNVAFTRLTSKLRKGPLCQQLK